MASQSLFEDCQHLIEKGQESWKSYFSKWENIGKQEENTLDSINEQFSGYTSKPVIKKKKQPISQTKRKKTKSILTYKKNLRNQKKIIKRKRISEKKVVPVKLEKHSTDLNKENEATFYDGAVLESSLKRFFRNFLTENKTNLEIFSVLSLTFSRSLESDIHNLFFNHQLALPYDSELNKGTLSCMNQQTVFSRISGMNLSSRLDNIERPFYLENFKANMKYADSCVQPLLTRKNEWIDNHIRSGRFKRFEFHTENNINKSLCVIPTQKITPEINMSNKITHLSLLKSPSYERSESSSLDFNSYHNSPISSCQKLRNKYLSKRNLPKMTVTLDEKRFRDLYLDKMTNSVSLSEENSNFTTPERKPSERKCFSKNVLQRKRRRSSKLFFDNEEDSDSDDQTEKRTPVIHCKGEKSKTAKRVTEVSESDSDECESIFDRVKKV